MKGKCHTTRFFRWIYVFAIPIWYIIAMTVKIPKVNRFRFQFMVKSILEYVHGTWNILQKLFKFFSERSSTKSIRLMLTCFFNLRDYLTVVRILKTFFFSLIHKNNVERRQQKKITSCTMSLIFKKKSKLFFMRAT